jgi:hypothetical protein
MSMMAVNAIFYLNESSVPDTARRVLIAFWSCLLVVPINLLVCSCLSICLNITFICYFDADWIILY